MADINVRPWLVAGWLHLLVAAALGLVAAAPSTLYPPSLHLLVAAAGIFLVGGGLAYGFASPFTKREVISRWPADAALALVLAGDALALAAAPLRLDALRWVGLLYGLGFAIVPLHLLATALAGKPWRDGIAIYAKDQPFRLGDIAAATAFACAMLALLGSGAWLAWAPRRVPTAPLVLFALGYALPFFGGILVFLLPRNAKTRLPGVTLVLAALVVELLAATALALGFLAPDAADLRFPSAGVLLALLLCGVALLRLRFPTPHAPQVRRALPMLRASAALAALAGLALPLSLAGGAPGSLFLPAAYATFVLLAALAASGTLLGAPILLNAVPREGRWAKWAGVLSIAGLFLLAPAFQYDRAAFPGAAVILAAAIATLWGLAPLRTPRRDCPPE